MSELTSWLPASPISLRDELPSVLLAPGTLFRVLKRVPCRAGRRLVWCKVISVDRHEYLCVQRLLTRATSRQRATSRPALLELPFTSHGARVQTAA